MSRFTLVLPLIAAMFMTQAGAQTTLDEITVPEGFVVERAADSDLTAYPMFMTFDETGRMYIAESTGKDLSGKEMVADPECRILRLVDEDGDGVYDSKTVFATELSLPMGVLWHQGSLFVASPPDFLRFDDTDGDGVADHREVLLTGWNVFNTASLHGPFLGPDGRLYLTHGRHGYAIDTKEGEHLEGLAARVWRCWPDGTGLERWTGGGFDNPVELQFLPGGEMIGTMTYFTDPKHGKRDALLHFVRGGVYPKPHESISEFVHTGPDLMPVMTEFSRIAPSGLEQLRSEAFGAGYRGNLFSAQFNPHRVQRHRLIREGATYRTEDEDFLTATNPDFYPTDVLEDADGSLLVSDTGAWYVDACPISRVAKPNVKGAIYRVRKDGAKALNDPWGNKIDWTAQSIDALIALLDDFRVRVRDRAVEHLVATGKDAIPTLSKTLRTHPNETTRLLSLRCVWRIRDAAGIAAIHQALNDESEAVRMTAAQALGDLKVADSVPDLIALLDSGNPPEQRAAAAALGEIGDNRATDALLKVTESPMDRMLDHAVIYALIELADRDALFEVVDAGWRKNEFHRATVKAAMIALDQLGDERLTADHLLPFLNGGSDPVVLPTGLWIASRHPEFGPEVLAYFKTVIGEHLFEPRESVAKTFLAYAHLPEYRAYIGATLNTKSYPSNGASQEFMLDIIGRMKMNELPAEWLSGIATCLSADPEIVGSGDLNLAALNLIRSLGIDSMDDALLAIAENLEKTDVYRIKALGAMAPRIAAFSDSQVDLVLANLNRTDNPGLRQDAGRILASANLSAQHKLAIANEQFKNVDALVLTSLIQLFSGESDAALGDALINGLMSNANIGDLLTEDQLETALAEFPARVKTKAEPLRAQLAHRDAELTDRFLSLEPQLGTGDVGRGRRIFFGDVAACSTCHAIGEDGGTLGPDLTTIGEVRTGHDLLEAVLFPSSSFVPDYVPYLIEMKNNELLSGLIGNQSTESITLNTGANESRHIMLADITSMTTTTVSIMPEGLDAGFTDQELIDLITFLQSLDGNGFLEPAKHE